MGFINENGDYEVTFQELEEINEKLLKRIEELESNHNTKTMCAHCIDTTRRFDEARSEFRKLRVELEDLRELKIQMEDELDRLQASQLNPGEVRAKYVCSDCETDGSWHTPNCSQRFYKKCNTRLVEV